MCLFEHLQYQTEWNTLDSYTLGGRDELISVGNECLVVVHSDIL